MVQRQNYMTFFLSSRSLKIQLDLTGLEQGLTFFEFIYSQIASQPH